MQKEKSWQGEPLNKESVASPCGAIGSFSLMIHLPSSIIKILKYK